MYGWRVPTQYVVWIEVSSAAPLEPCHLASLGQVLLHQLLVPGSSVFSQLAGILSGYLYVHRSRWLPEEPVIPSIPQVCVFLCTLGAEHAPA